MQIMQLCHTKHVGKKLRQDMPTLANKPLQGRLVLTCSCQDKGFRMRLRADFQHIDSVVAINSNRLASAIKEHTASTALLNWESALNSVVAQVMGTESAIASMRILSGTHAINAAFQACLRPGDKLFCASGPPYDTLEEVIGTRGLGSQGSLADFGIEFHCHEFPQTSSGNLDEASLNEALRSECPNVCHIQRSCGYSLRPTLTVEELASIVKVVRSVRDNIIVTVDNCYGAGARQRVKGAGEFTEILEPGHVGADVVMGSFIKNPGGTIATGGGYIAGRKDIIDTVVTQWSGQHEHVSNAQALLHGLWLAPARVGEALKGGRLIVDYAHQAGLKAVPDDPVKDRPSVITAIQLDSAHRMIEFCELVQQQSPVGSYVKPVAGRTPGYESEVIFADGTFIDGCTSELSADGPLRAPHVVYCQGGTHWTHWQNVVLALSRKLQL